MQYLWIDWGRFVNIYQGLGSSLYLRFRFKYFLKFILFLTLMNDLLFEIIRFLSKLLNLYRIKK